MMSRKIEIEKKHPPLSLCSIGYRWDKELFKVCGAVTLVLGVLIWPVTNTWGSECLSSSQDNPNSHFPYPTLLGCTCQNLFPGQSFFLV